MRSCGIIVEYNPFHNGHRYHAEMAKKLSGADVVIAVMSGNFLQRGEPAFMDKWMRAEAALHNGVDLIVELPFSWAVQSADYFAKGGIKLLQALKCDALCFGTDSQETIDYMHYGQLFADNQTAVDCLFQQLPVGMSYPEKMAEVVRQLFPTIQEFPPNHILGLSYAKENAKYPNPMAIYPLIRKDQGYHDVEIVSEHFASATGIRKAFNRGEDITSFVPKETSERLEQSISWDNFWPFLVYQLTVNTADQMIDIYQMNEGIENRLKTIQADNFTAFLQQVKTKRYTVTRLQRLFTYFLLQVSPEEIRKEQEQSRLHILGFTKRGQEYLSQHKKSFNLPVAAKIGLEEKESHFLTYRADQLYQLIHPVEQNLGRTPIRL
ncbi:nucleotidyltransferase [Candidatus Enterococcus ferrettii]|uniref:tRNA(Met) cytidine acetate ligase n=1 Tax=Candidatus Enterococcus ferrettii TaxID=2815324 RepID=A0ABV0EVZ1_9ENTE|nr:nucleotidyltransferase [Enterococcus sp. 665A]MBO1339924.1 nucleotidyltransferase [Enterococcus sp. 665A]